MRRRPAPLSAKEVKGGFAPFHEIRVEPRLPCAPNPREGIRGFFDAAADRSRLYEPVTGILQQTLKNLLKFPRLERRAL